VPLQFQISDLFFATFAAGLVGLAYRFDLLLPLSSYADLWILVGVAACGIGLVCLGAGRVTLGTMFVLVGAFGCAVRSVFLALGSFGWIGRPDLIAISDTVWSATCTGLAPIGLTLVCVLWVAWKRSGDIPWYLVPSLVICWLNLWILAAGTWIILRLAC
jgi:hypothetical protein